MGKKKRPPKISPEEQARFDAFTEEINPRISERRARERAAESQDDKSR